MEAFLNSDSIVQWAIIIICLLMAYCVNKAFRKD